VEQQQQQQQQQQENDTACHSHLIFSHVFVKSFHDAPVFSMAKERDLSHDASVISLFSEVQPGPAWPGPARPGPAQPSPAQPSPPDERFRFSFLQPIHSLIVVESRNLNDDGNIEYTLVVDRV